MVGLIPLAGLMYISWKIVSNSHHQGFCLWPKSAIIRDFVSVCFPELSCMWIILLTIPLYVYEVKYISYTFNSQRTVHYSGFLVAADRLRSESGDYTTFKSQRFKKTNSPWLWLFIPHDVLGSAHSCVLQSLPAPATVCQLTLIQNTTIHLTVQQAILFRFESSPKGVNTTNTAKRWISVTEISLTNSSRLAVIQSCHFNMGSYGAWFTFGVSLKWPFGELQFLAIWHWLNCSAPGGSCLSHTESHT